jgi:hypothetical protein
MAPAMRRRLAWCSLAQVIAAVLVVGSYFLAEELKVRRPRRRGRNAAIRSSAPPPRPALRAGP